MALNTIKAIPTTYQGINLKSRFEADIAFLIDNLKYKWQYEPKSFLLDDGTHYLPDFYLPDLRLFIECRGYESEKGEAQINGFGKLITTADKSILKRPLTLEYDHNIYPDYLAIGPQSVVFYESVYRYGVGKSEDAIMAQCDKCDKWFFVGASGSYQCRNCGRWDGDHHMKDARWLNYQDGALLIGYLKATVREFIEQTSEG